MANFPAVYIPAFEFQSNLVVYPLPTEVKTVRKIGMQFFSTDIYNRARVTSMY